MVSLLTLPSVVLSPTVTVKPLQLPTTAAGKVPNLDMRDEDGKIKTGLEDLVPKKKPKGKLSAQDRAKLTQAQQLEIKHAEDRTAMSGQLAEQAKERLKQYAMQLEAAVRRGDAAAVRRLAMQAAAAETQVRNAARSAQAAAGLASTANAARRADFVEKIAEEVAKVAEKIADAARDAERKKAAKAAAAADDKLERAFS